MEDDLEHFLLSCSDIDFGPVALSGKEEEFYKAFNREIISLCDFLPESIQTDALLFFMEYSGLSIDHHLDFFKNYYIPSWSIIYWLTQYLPGHDLLTKEDIKNALTAHAMAMKLHSMDDHMTDRELPASHLTLLLRSQAWMNMMNAFENLSNDVDKGENIVSDLIDEYYSSILNLNIVKSLDDYCDLFRKQMATWLIAPVLLANKMTDDVEFAADVRKIYESFGIAWRLLDDVNDIEIDMKNGTHSSIYMCLPKSIRGFWDKNELTESINDNSCYIIVLGYIHKNGVVNRIQERIAKELELAASISENHNMTGLAGELHSLLRPFNN